MLKHIEKIKPTVDAEVECIDPDMARAILKRTRVNRNIQKQAVAKYAKSMTEGLWTIAQPIILDEEGFLVDGQHRLMAVVRAGEPQEFLVVRGLDRDSMFHIDIGKPRSINDILKIRGHKSVSTQAAIARMVMAAERGAKQPRFVSTMMMEVPYDDIVERIESDTNIQDATNLAAGQWRPMVRGLRSAGMGGWFIYMGLTGMNGSESLWQDFCDIVSGRTVARRDDDPAFAIYKRLNRPEGAGNQTNPDIRLALLIKAWNMFVAGEPAKRISYRPFGSSAERFPSMLTDLCVDADFGSNYESSS